jgi:hypothetical protein
MVAGQRVADQHRVAAVGVQRAVGLVGDLKRRELDAGVELQRPLDPRHKRIARRIGLAAAPHNIKRDTDIGHRNPGSGAFGG